MSGLRTRFIESRDGKRIRTGVWDAAPGIASRGVCVLLDGQTEFLEKYDLDSMPLPPSWRAGLGGKEPRQGTCGLREQFLKLGPDIETNLRRVWRAYLGCMSFVDLQIGRILTELSVKFLSGLRREALFSYLTKAERARFDAIIRELKTA